MGSCDPGIIGLGGGVKAGELPVNSPLAIVVVYGYIEEMIGKLLGLFKRDMYVCVVKRE